MSNILHLTQYRYDILSNVAFKTACEVNEYREQCLQSCTLIRSYKGCCHMNFLKLRCLVYLLICVQSGYND
jgi:hypothetical protein